MRFFIQKRVCLGFVATVTTALGLSCFIGCAPSPKAPPKAKAPGTLSTDASANLGAVKSAVTVDDLDSAAMRLNMLGRASYTHGRYKFPIITFSFPEQADYVQVLRCRGDANLGELGNIEIGASNTKAADAIYQNKDFWQKISSNAFCAYITTGTSIDKVIDFYANSGDYVYVARACVEKSRLNASDPDVLANPCSRQVGKTEIYNGYVNLDKNLATENKEKLRAQRDKVDAMGRELVYLAKLGDQQISECEKRRGANRASKYRREALGKIIGTGIDLGAKLLSDGLTKSVLGGLSGFADIFKDLSADPNDYLPADFCPAFDLSLERMKQLKTQVEVESKDYNERIKTFGGAP